MLEKFANKLAPKMWFYGAPTDKPLPAWVSHVSESRPIAPAPHNWRQARQQGWASFIEGLEDAEERGTSKARIRVLVQIAPMDWG